MYLIESKRDGKWIMDPGLAMAFQEYIKTEIVLDETILMPYIMQPAIQIGKFQNAYEEVNVPYLEENDIKIVRRETGGGAIYLDERNMSFSFLFNDDNQNIYGNYKKLYAPAVEALKKLGVSDVVQEGRNDLVVDNKKVSGAAMTLYKGRIYAGFSLLTDPNYEAMVAALNPNQKKITSHGIKSIRSRVGSLRDYFNEEYQQITLDDFTTFMICSLMNIDTIDQAKRYELTPEDWEKIDQINRDKYSNWDWNYGRFKVFENHVVGRIDKVGTLRIAMKVEHAKIDEIQITGDFFGKKEIQTLEEHLKGTRLEKAALNDVLDDIKLTEYIAKLDQTTFIKFIMSELN
ncbi:MAG TPA: lipoate--protein ligase [Pseudogracilibacillus sp.]|nr:lipoate--protein ligase [Pseudogracilibacillus sp.]